MDAEGGPPGNHPLLRFVVRRNELAIYIDIDLVINRKDLFGGLKRESVSGGPPHRGLIGLYALACMERQRTVHGYELADRIAERTQGSWRPGPGAIYPALQQLIRRRLAEEHKEGRRRVYSITTQGRAVLARVRARNPLTGRGPLNFVPIWADVVGVDDEGRLLGLWLRRVCDAVEDALATQRVSGANANRLRADVTSELQRLARRPSRRLPRTSPAPRPRPIA